MPILSRTQRPLKEFHLFPNLPIELRLKIWALSAAEPCIVTQNEKRPEFCRSIPPVLHACRESRNEFLAEAKLTNSKCSHPTYTLIRVKYPVYFSFEI